MKLKRITKENYNEMLDETLLFLKKIKGKEGVMEITNLYENLGDIDDYKKIIKEYEFEDLFFGSYLPTQDLSERLACGEALPRGRDCYAAGKSYFAVDFDINRNIAEATGKLIGDESKYQMIEKIAKVLKTDKVLGTFNAIVDSGHGAHFYRAGNMERMSSEEYKNGAEYFLNRITELLIKNDLSVLKPDFACSNMTRLFRLPGSANCKDLDEEFTRIPVNLIYFKDSISPLVGTLKSCGANFANQRDEKTQQEIKIMREKEFLQISFNLIPSEYEAINTKIDIRDLVLKYTGWKLAPNGKNFISQRNGGYTGAYVIPEENVVVRRGTPWIDDTYNVQSPYTFIYLNYANKNKAETFKRAEENYPSIMDNQPRFNFKTTIKYGG